MMLKFASQAHATWHLLSVVHVEDSACFLKDEVTLGYIHSSHCVRQLVNAYIDIINSCTFTFNCTAIMNRHFSSLMVNLPQVIVP